MTGNSFDPAAAVVPALWNSSRPFGLTEALVAQFYH